MKQHILRSCAVLLPLALSQITPAYSQEAASHELPVLVVQALTTTDPEGYAHWVAKGNEAFHKAGGPENFTHVYQGVVAGEDTGKCFAVRFAPTAADLFKMVGALMKVPESHEIL